MYKFIGCTFLFLSALTCQADLYYEEVDESYSVSSMPYNSYYVDISMGLLNAKKNSTTLKFEDTVEINTLSATIGYQMNPFLSFEVRLAGGIDSSAMHVDLTANNANMSTDVLLKVDNIFGGYVRAQYPINQVIPYIIGGYTKGRVEITVPEINTKEIKDESSLSYGAGIDFKINQHFYGKVEYVMYWDNNKSGNTLSGLIFGLYYPF